MLGFAGWTFFALRSFCSVVDFPSLSTTLCLRINAELTCRLSNIQLPVFRCSLTVHHASNHQMHHTTVIEFACRGNPPATDVIYLEAALQGLFGGLTSIGLVA